MNTTIKVYESKNADFKSANISRLLYHLTTELRTERDIEGFYFILPSLSLWGKFKGMTKKLFYSLKTAFKIERK